MKLVDIILGLYPNTLLDGDRIIPCPVCGSETKKACRYFDDTDSVYCHDPDCDLNVHSYKKIDFLELTGNTLKAFALMKGSKVEAEVPDRLSSRKEAIWKVRNPIYRKIYKVAAELLNMNLFDNTEESRAALGYQVEERGHSIETLKAWKVGYYSTSMDLMGTLIYLGKINGWWEKHNVEDCGLFKNYGALTSYHFISHNLTYSYPILWKGEVCSIKFKPPKLFADQKDVPLTIKKEITGNDFPDVLGNLNAPEIILVEGENDFLSMQEAGYRNTVCLCGSPRESQFRHMSPAQIRRFAFDHDAAGGKYVERFEARGLAGTIFDFPPSFKDPDDWLKKRG